ncbi:uncharacterized protein LOC127861946 [Dreissena polymorpha]|uniref:Uncharacterized protein n=1 Tax=Dreissena polymorpha TaxID=45954 RepID=A0A9D4NG79_DREPO|nr:uncharacterized protein LOC127861946 [Dreissena polymorpha]KAH3894096.1 hypothetical protein DPMN_018254 [Dreissena polymorpha]
MHKVSFPPLSSGIQVSVAAREPPERSWSRYKKVLIDNPKDSNLLQRQKLWNFQKLNRGAFRSQLASLPDIPYRVHTGTVEKVSVGVQADLSNRFSQGLKIIFPNLTSQSAKIFESTSGDEDADDIFNSDQRHKGCSPMKINEDGYSDDFEDDSDIEDPGFEFETVVRKQNAGTMTYTNHRGDQQKRKEKRKRTVRERNAAAKQRSSILRTGKTPSSGRKNVKFSPKSRTAEDNKRNVYENSSSPETDIDLSDPDVPSGEEEEEPTVIQKIEITNIERDHTISPIPSFSSGSSQLPDLKLNIGHTSHLSLDNVSILDYISGNRTDRSHRGNSRKAFTSREQVNSKRQVEDAMADREWFEKLVGDKDIIDTGMYNNFARVRPALEQSGHSDSNNDRSTDFIKGTPRKNFTPRSNNDFSVYKQAQPKAGQQKATPNSTANVNRIKPARKSMIGIGKFY